LFNSIRTKIAIPVVGILIALVLFMVLYVSASVRAFSMASSDERLQGAAHAAKAYFSRVERYNEMTVRVLASDVNIIALANEWNSGENHAQTRYELFGYLGEAINDFRITNIVMTGQDGTMIIRTHEPERYGDSGIEVMVTMSNALKYGEISTTYISTPTLPIALSSVSPIRYNGEIIGTIGATVDLSIMDLIDEFGETFNAEITIFAGAQAVATTLYADYEAGIRATGDVTGNIVNPLVIESVLNQGIPLNLELPLFGAPHRGYYFPLLNEGDAPIGMFFIGFSLEDDISNTNALVANLMLISFIGLAIAAAVMLLGINASANRVSRLAKIVESITKGGEYTELQPESNDEVGVLTTSINMLVDTIRKLSSSDKGINEIKQEIDESKRNAIEAQAANKAKSDFLSTMSHEIRTPIGAILGTTEIQLRNMKHSPETREAFETIYTSGDMLLGIINDILDLSKIEAGKMELFADRYEVASMIADTAQLNILRIGSKPIQFEISVDEEIPTHLFGDELRIKQILNNLLSNAFKYTDKGCVKMSVAQEANADGKIFLVLQITDTGQGMTEEQVRTLFDEFTRFNMAANREAEGTGLGMSIVKNLVRMMDGEVLVESERGQGSVFTIRIPQDAVTEEVIGAQTAENLSKFKYMGQVRLIQSEWEPMPYGKILVVDDLAANVYVARGFLAPYGLKVDSADNGFSAIQKIESGEVYDLILMDHMMPQMDGIETVRRIREMGYTGAIVAFTANALVGQEELFLKNGFDSFTSKPIQSTHLNSLLNKFVRDTQSPELIAAAKNMSGDIYAKINSQQISHTELCKDFAKSQSNIIPEIQRVMESKDFKTAHLLTHTLKSLAGLIGEDELRTLAANAEADFRKEIIPDITQLSTELERVLKKLNDIYRIPAQPPQITDPTKIAEILDNLQNFLLQNNAEVITLIPDLVAIPKTEDIVHNIENYNFTQALECVRKLQASLTQ